MTKTTGNDLYAAISFCKTRDEAENINQFVSKIDGVSSTGWYDTLCLHCAENDINLDNVSDTEFENIAEMMSDYGSNENWDSRYPFYVCIDTKSL